MPLRASCSLGSSTPALEYKEVRLESFSEPISPPPPARFYVIHCLQTGIRLEFAQGPLHYFQTVGVNRQRLYPAPGKEYVGQFNPPVVDQELRSRLRHVHLANWRRGCTQDLRERLPIEALSAACRCRQLRKKQVGGFAQLLLADREGIHKVGAFAIQLDPMRYHCYQKLELQKPSVSGFPNLYILVASRGYQVDVFIPVAKQPKSD